MSRVLLVHQSLQPPGGGNGVAAWVLEALKGDHLLSVLTWRRVDLPEINRFFGTSLCASDFRVVRAPAAARRLVDLAPVQAGLLKASLLLRACQRMKDDYDVIFSTNNEGNFGRRGIQYIHFPSTGVPRPRCDVRWYHRCVPAVLAYRSFCLRVARFSAQRVRDNLTLVNSDFIGRKFAAAHGTHTVTVYPPAPGAFAERAWAERESGFVCVGRIAPEKELEKLIDIVGALRARVADAHLHIVGTPGVPWYYQRIRRLARQHAAWVSLEENLEREAMVGLLARHRYGIHGMREEPFGMAVAEMVQAGCIVFVPAGGGQTEIVGDEPSLVYASRAEALAKITAVMQDPTRQAALRVHLGTRRALFSTERFMRRIREIVADFANGNPHTGG